MIWINYTSMSQLKTWITWVWLASTLASCHMPNEGTKSYQITMRTGAQVATIIIDNNTIICTKNLEQIRRVPQITEKQDTSDYIQLKQWIIFQWSGFNIARTPDGIYTTINTTIPSGTTTVARIINKWWNGTKNITKTEQDNLCKE